MKISRKKTEYLCIAGENEQEGDIKLQGVDVPRVNALKYLGSTVQKDGHAHVEIGGRINVVWYGWKKITGVFLCNRRVPN